MNDIIKGVVYNRGTATLQGEKRYMALVAMIIASDEPIAVEGVEEFIVMGAANVSKEMKQLIKYETPYKFGEISHAIISVSEMNPDELNILVDKSEPPV